MLTFLLIIAVLVVTTLIAIVVNIITQRPFDKRLAVVLVVLILLGAVLTTIDRINERNYTAAQSSGSRTLPSAGPSSGPTPPSTTNPGVSVPPPTSSVPPPSPGSASPAEVEYNLADFNTVGTYGINVDSTPRSVNGNLYNHPVAWSASISADDPYWAEWNLSRNCSRLTIPAVGIADEAPSGSRYVFYVQTDGANKWEKAINLGQSYPVDVSIAGALRLRLSVAGLEKGYEGPFATWGDAKVSCSSEPSNRKG